MKTAEEVAETICQEFRRLNKEDKGCACRFIEKAITAYAEEYANTHYSNVLKKWADGHSEDVAKARDEALEEAAKEAEKHVEHHILKEKLVVMLDSVFDDIRALVNKK